MISLDVHCTAASLLVLPLLVMGLLHPLAGPLHPLAGLRELKELAGLTRLARHCIVEGVEGLFYLAGGRCCKKYVESKGLMVQDLKPLNMFWGINVSTKAFVHNSTNEPRVVALPLHSLCHSFSKHVKAFFKALKILRSSGCMTSVKRAGTTTISTPSSLHSVIFDRVMWVFEPSTTNTTQPYSFCFGCTSTMNSSLTYSMEPAASDQPPLISFCFCLLTGALLSLLEAAFQLPFLLSP